MLKWLKAKKLPGFTLLELVVVIVVIGILAAIAIPTFSGVVTRANDAKAQTTMAAIARDALVIYKMDNGSTPLDWYNAFNEAVAETPVAAEYSLAAETSLTLTLDLPHATTQQIQDAAAFAASVDGPAPALAGPSASPSQLSVFVDGSNNVGMAIASTGNCVFGTVIGQEITTWSAKKDLGADCAGSIAFLDTVTVAALEVRDVSDYSSLTLPIAGTLGAPTTVPASISFAVNFTATATAPIDSFEISRNGTILDATVLAPLASYTDNTAVDGVSYTYSVRAQNSVGYSTAVTTSAATSYALPAAPAAPILEVGDTQLSINWVSPSISSGAPITGYRLYRSESSGPYILAATLTPETTLDYNDTGLNNGTAYAYQLESYGAGGASTRSPPSESSTPITTPLPIELGTTNQSPGAITVNFTSISTAAAPVASVSVTRNGSAYLTLNSTDTTFTDNTITNGQSYTYAFVTHNAIGSSASTSTTALTSYAVPAAPSFTTQAAGISQNSLAWSEITGTSGTPVSGYRLYRSTDGTLYTLLVQQIETTYLDNTTINGTDYTYQVESYGTGGTSLRSVTSNTLTPLAVPAIAPELMPAASNLTNTLTWTAVASTTAAPVTGYDLQTSPNGTSSWTTIYTGALLTYTHTALTNGADYYYRVAATNSMSTLGNETFTTAALSVPIAIPVTPASLVATSGNASVALSWGQVASTSAAPVSGYRIYSSSTFNGTYLLRATITPATTITTTDSALINGSTYFYQIETYGTAGTSARSSYFPTGGSTPSTVPAAPTIGSASGGTSGVVTVSFTGNSNGGSVLTAPYYTVTSSSGRTNSGATSPIVVTEVTGGSYTYSVKATNANGQSAASAISNSVTSSFITPTVDYLVVAGGGGGGSSRGGGGGGGGFLTGAGYTISSSFTVSVGAGGNPGYFNGANPTNGGNSNFDAVIAYGGGNGYGAAGGSGGGSQATGSGSGLGATGWQGGRGSLGNGLWGGGGGGGAGGNASAMNGGGGASSSYSGSSVCYAGGGGGGSDQNTAAGYSGGCGGGNGASAAWAPPAASGTANTGGGGGGAIATAGAGGSGIVIIRYPSNYADLTSITGLGYSKTVVGGYKIYTFTSGSGTVTR